MQIHSSPHSTFTAISREGIQTKFLEDSQGFGTDAHIAYKTKIVLHFSNVWIRISRKCNPSRTKQMDYYLLFWRMEKCNCGKVKRFSRRNLTTRTMNCQLMVFYAVLSSLTHSFTQFESSIKQILSGNAFS